MYQTRAKLFMMEDEGTWKERGVGLLKLNKRREDGGGARLGEWLASCLLLTSSDARGWCAASHSQFFVVCRHVVLRGRQACPHDHLRGRRAPVCDD